jgi:hypothetical protein
VTQLSDADEHSLKIQVDSVPAGFKVVQLKHGIGFYCASCDIPSCPDDPRPACHAGEPCDGADRQGSGIGNDWPLTQSD